MLQGSNSISYSNDVVSGDMDAVSDDNMMVA